VEIRKSLSYWLLRLFSAVVTSRWLADTFVLKTHKEANAGGGWADTIVMEFLRQEEAIYTAPPDPFEFNIRSSTKTPGSIPQSRGLNF